MPRPEDLLHLHTVDDVQWNPAGDRLSFTRTSIDAEADAYRTAIWTITPQGTDLQCLAGEQASRARWSPDGEHVVVLSHRDGAPALYVVFPDGGKAGRLTEPGLFVRIGVPAWSPDGESIAFSAVQRPARASTAPRHITRAHFQDDNIGYIHDDESPIFAVVSRGGLRRLTPKGTVNDSPAWSPDGQWIAFARTRRGVRDYHTSDIWVMRRDGSEARRVSVDISRAQVPAWSPDGQTLACYGHRGADTIYGDPMVWLWTIDVASGHATCRTDRYDRSVVMPVRPVVPAPPLWRADGSSLYVLVADRGQKHVVEVQLPHNSVAPVVSGPQSVSSFSLHQGRIAYTAARPDSPGEVYCNDQALTALNTHRWPTVERRTFATPHGTHIDGWLVRPPAAGGPVPLLLNIHGGPHSHFGDDFPSNHFHSYTLVDQGWAVLSLNPCGSGSYGTEFAHAIRGVWGEHDMAEHLAAVDTLIAEGVADADRLAITGYSYGGFMTSFILTRSERFKAAVVGGPVTNLESFFGTSDFGIWWAPFEMNGTVFEQREAYRALSPIQRVEHITTPTLILHGEADHRCPIGQSEELFAGLMAAGRVPVEFVRYPDAAHMFFMLGRPSHRVDYVRRIGDWVEQYTRPPV